MMELFGVGRDGIAKASTAWIASRPPAKVRHRFGGPARHRGAVPPGGEEPLLLLFDLDLSDPNVPFAIPGVSRLPLYNALRYGSASFVYQVASDAEIRIVHFPADRKFTPDFPYATFPPHLPEKPAEIDKPEPIDFDEEEEAWTELWSHDGPFGKPTASELIRLHAYVRQEYRDAKYPCENPKCRRADTDLIAVLHREPFAGKGILLWDEREDHEPRVVIRYRLCLKCHAVHVANLVN